MIEDDHPKQLRILAADDDKTTLLLYRRILSSRTASSDVHCSPSDEFSKGKKAADSSSQSFDVVTCRQGQEAVDAVKKSIEEQHPFAVAFLDVRMPPGLDGIQTAEQIRHVDTSVEIVLVTGYSDMNPREVAPRILPAHKLLYIQKPFQPREIYQFASALGEKWRTERELLRIHAVLEQRIEERTYELTIINTQLQADIARRKIAEERLLLLEQGIEIMQLGMTITDLEGTIIYTNAAEAAMHGYQAEELVGQNIGMLTAPELKKPPTLKQIQGWRGLVRESVNLRKDGTTFPVWLMSEIVQNVQGEPCAIVTSCEDITKRKQVERALRESEEKHRIVLESAPDPIMVYDISGHITYLNPAFSRVFGWTLEEIVRQDSAFVPVESRPETNLIFEKIRHGERLSGKETSWMTKQGKRVDVSISGAGFFDSHGILQGIIITIQDITERKKHEQEIAFLAYHDVLTGLPNRKSFYLRLEDELLRSQSQNGDKRRARSRKWALCFLDVDRFKSINDTRGHDVGDELLKRIVGRLKSCLRKSDYIFRFGGDEFAILLNDLSESTDMARVAKKIREEVARPCQIASYELYVTISIGISIYPDDGDTIDTLVRNADMALHAAKKEHEGYRFFTEEMNKKALERMMLENHLRTALQYQQFSLAYQALVDSRNRIVGTEALLRWYHPEMGNISPVQFIPLAEETGAIVPIGEWVLHSAYQQTRVWHDMGYTGLHIAVNLSTRQFRDPALVDTIEQVLETTGLPPDCLELEVTESDIMENPEQAIEKMNILRARGIHFSIDDFGTGYSSLSYLKRFPIDTLKIDRSFVTDCVTNKDDQEIIKTIISMANNLGMLTVAEGVETREQQAFLIRHGCHIMQGYYFNQPLPADQFEDMLRSNS